VGTEVAVREIDEARHIRRVKQETDNDKETWQIRVEWDEEDGLIEIAEEKMTSPSADSQPYRGIGRQINLRRADCDWFMKALAEVIARRDASDTVKDDGS
jgi:hypothetical protein